MKSVSIKKVAPVLFAYFVMGFCDAVGISSNYIKQDYGLSETNANLLPLMVFLWFFFFSVPIGEMMNKIGQKRIVLISMTITVLSMILSYIFNSFPMILLAFALLGIGNW